METTFKKKSLGRIPPPLRERELFCIKVNKYYTEITDFCINIFTKCKKTFSINIEVLKENEVKSNLKKWHVIQFHFHFHIH
jgi:hypothetical protein